MGAVRQFEDLAIFQQARDLCKGIYAITENGPWKNDYRFVQQIHAAAGSIMDNIAEGFERSGNKELVNFLYIAKGSCGEVRSQLLRAFDCGFINKEVFDKYYVMCRRLNAAIMNTIKEIRDSEFKGEKYK